MVCSHLCMCDNIDWLALSTVFIGKNSFLIDIQNQKSVTDCLDCKNVFTETGF